MASSRTPGPLGAVAAALIVAAWLGSLWLGLVADLTLSTVRGASELAAFVALRTFLYVGLFITAHDAMHGTVVPSSPRCNDVVGRICLALYATLPWRALRTAHLEHHAHPGSLDDPDWCADQRFAPWLWSFVRRYVDGWIVLRNAALLTMLVVVGGGTVLDAFALHALPAWLSVVQLFTFGTWLPHRATGAPLDDEHRARSSNAPAIVSFVSCYHFGRHLEHHRAPHVPWWALQTTTSMSGARDA